MRSSHSLDRLEATYAAGRQAVTARGTGRVQASRAHRTYLLTGILECSCGRRLHGQTRASRGHEWKYYLCRDCGRPAISASVADAAVLVELRWLILPPEAFEAARDELRRRLALPSRGSSDELRTRLERRLERLKAQYEWGDVADAEYRAKMTETRDQLALLPEPEKVLTFDAVAGVVATLSQAMAAASQEQLKALIGMLVARVKATDDGRYEIEPVPSARPFFAPCDSLLLAPPDGLGGTGAKRRPARLVRRVRVIKD